MKYLLSTILILVSCLSVTSCSDDPLIEDPETYYKSHKGERTIIAYMINGNNLTYSLNYDINEMVNGSYSLSDRHRLIVFTNTVDTPYIARIENGTTKVLKRYDKAIIASSPNIMHEVYQWIIDNYPSNDYVTIIGGHGSGSIQNNDTVASNIIRRYAFGGEKIDGKQYWINVQGLADVFSNLVDADGNNIHFSTMLLDVCSSQNVETAYELRKYTDYIIAPVSETPQDGGDFRRIIPAMGAASSNLADSIYSTYVSGQQYACVSLVKTEYLEELCNQTAIALNSRYSGTGQLILDRQNCIYYYRELTSEQSVDRAPTLYDMRNVLKKNLDSDVYESWYDTFNKVVLKQNLPNSLTWPTSLNINFYSFRSSLNDEYYGGLSMMIPYNGVGSTLTPLSFQYMNRLEWYHDMGWSNFGW